MTMRRAAASGGRHRADQGQITVIEMVGRDGTAHVLTVIAGDDAPPAALIARQARYCPLCVPAQRKAQ